MAINSIRRSGADKSGSANSKDSGYTIDPGPYEATVLGHVKGSRSGQLLVSIEDQNIPIGPENESPAILGNKSSGIVVSYASPFFGTTFGTDTGVDPSTALLSGQSYGMWMVPPDIGNRVLVVFCGGQRDRGYWFGCVYDTPSHHMVPAIGRGPEGKTVVADDQFLKYFNSSSNLPAAEAPTGGTNPAAFAPDALDAMVRYPHEIQALSYVMQGLDTDKIRGAISSSSMRESPSNVYGISTPGRRITNGNQDDYARTLEIVKARKGGHTFVMDDGDKDGADQLIRLRTSGGHQILMNDTEKILYIASNTGNQWMEFSADGAINVYGAAGINMRSKGPMNFHSDSSISMNAASIAINGTMNVKIESLVNVNIGALGMASLKAGGALSLTGLGIVNLQAGGMLKVGALGAVSIDGLTVGLNCGSIPTPLPPIPSIPKSHDEASFTGTNWNPKGASVLSVCTVVPGHEPWIRPAPKT